MVFVESPWFKAWCDEHLGDERLRDLQNLLLESPDAGDLIRNSGGLRKMRVALPGRGKRGGARVIYYHWVSRDRLYLLIGYAKNVQAELTRDQLKRLAAAMNEDLEDG